jgi:malonate-semialdehyde dehydrogenase (acetylating)/methylmalonate-semialdehyde dehydrogenase
MTTATATPPQTKTAPKYSRVGNVIGGKVVPSSSNQFLPVHCPRTGEVIAEVPVTTKAELDEAVRVAAKAQKEWAALSVKDRVQVLFRMKTNFERRADELAAVCSEENGKTPAEAKAGLIRGIECIEYACSLPQIARGDLLEVSRGVECRMVHVPVGVVASITPFNFPLMVPLWTVPLAIGCGNAIILKPSEQTPLSALKLMEVFEESGVPAGIVSIVHGNKPTVDAILEHPQIEAISFVGSTRVAKHVYETGSKHGKRVRALGGAKNHLVVMPDADPEMTAKNVVASATGCAGQRCMAASVMVAVGDDPKMDAIIGKIREYASQIRVGKDMGAIISAPARDRIVNYINSAEKQGCKLLLDGRRPKLEGDAQESGYHVGPTVIDGANPGMDISCDEIFGPVLTILRVKSLEDALKIENTSPYGNAASIYTSDGATAQHFAERASAGMIGVNVGVPVPREPFSFGGWNDSKFGAGDITGDSAIEFWTKQKKITAKWADTHRANWMS